MILIRGGGLGRHLLRVPVAGLPPLSTVLVGIRVKMGCLSSSTNSQEEAEEDEDEEDGDGSAGSGGEDGVAKCCNSNAWEPLASTLISCMKASCQCRVTAVKHAHTFQQTQSRHEERRSSREVVMLCSCQEMSLTVTSVTSE